VLVAYNAGIRPEINGFAWSAGENFPLVVLPKPDWLGFSRVSGGILMECFKFIGGENGENPYCIRLLRKIWLLR
jgi:hypothetical protein